MTEKCCEAMIKKLIKNQIRKTGTYRALEIEKNRLETQVNKLQKDKDNYYSDKLIEIQNLKDHVKRIHNEKLELKQLINNLKAENKSLKQVYLENNVITSQDYGKLTIIIPYRKTDDPEREENVDITLRYLSKIGIKNLILSEHADETSQNYFMNKYGNLFDSFRFIFNNANGDLFNKAHAINKGVVASKTPYFSIVDIDCLTKKENIDLAIYLLEKGFEVVHPFNRVIKDIVNKGSFRKEHDFQTVESPPQYRDWADGGIVFWNKSAFIGIGMKNEYFSGWGGEDNEIILQANLCQLKQVRIDETLYHLYHDRPQIRTKNNVEQTRKVEQIKTKEDLLNEIKQWPWVKG
jgi:hypothetical protein